MYNNVMNRTLQLLLLLFLFCKFCDTNVDDKGSCGKIEDGQLNQLANCNPLP